MAMTLTAQTDGVSHARRVLDLLRQEKFADVAKEFNAQMAAALPAQTLAQVWAAMRTQVGEFKSESSQQSANAGGVNVVTLGVQFERAAANMVVAFDAENKIAGLQFVPRPAEAPAASLPAGLTEEAFTVGSGQFALPGTLTLPPGTARVAAVVLVHGSGPEDRDETLGPNKPFRDLAWGLASRGVAVLRYEKRTRQYAAAMAQNANLTVREEAIDDAVLAEQALRRHARIEANKVYIAGHSLGGMLAPRIGQEGPLHRRLNSARRQHTSPSRTDRGADRVPGVAEFKSCRGTGNDRRTQSAGRENHGSGPAVEHSCK
jgi:hypothetical protein